MKIQNEPEVFHPFSVLIESREEGLMLLNDLQLLLPIFERYTNRPRYTTTIKLIELLKERLR